MRLSIVQSADNLIYDLVAPLHAPPVDDRIIIATIDTDTIAAIGRWPWPRHIHAEALKRIKAARPNSIIYDILFVEPTNDDALLAQAAKGGAPVFLPMMFDIPGPNGTPWQVRRPVASLATVAAGIGTANLILDDDGRARSIAVATWDGDTLLPHLTEYAYRHMIGHPSPAFLRTEREGTPLRIAFHEPGSFRSIPLLHILRGEVPDAFLRDKIVIVGATSDGLGDLHPVSTAQAGRMAGAEVQANLLSSLLADRFISAIPVHWVIGISLLPFWLLLIAFWKLTPTQGLILSIVITVTTLLGSILILMLVGMWFPPVAALLGVTMVHPLWSWRRLAAVSQFMRGEVSALLAQTGLGSPAPDQDWSHDRVASDAGRLHQVIDLMRRNAREREEMLQFLSHDMRSPQAAILALLQDPTSLSDDASLQARIQSYAEQTLRLADDFVQLARIQSRKVAAQPVDVRDAMAQAADMIWPRSKAKEIRILRQDDEGMDDQPELWIMGDPESLVRAFSNLFGNAVQASPQHSSIRYGARRQDGYAIAWIADNGPDLPPERQADPFGRFGYSGGTEGERGSGLGLAYVEAVAVQHGGTAEYQSNPDGGACFTLRLPLASEDKLTG